MKIALPAALPAILLGTLSFSVAQPVPTESHHGLAAFPLESDQVNLVVTRTGGHMAPVTFFRDSDHPVRPYYISPWQGEGGEQPAPVLVPLRGDFFCLPFGGNGEAYRGEVHPPHGETAGSEWRFVSRESVRKVVTLNLELETRVRAGKVRKSLSLVAGQNVVYSTHTVTGFRGRTSLGHHAILAMPEEEEVFKISHSPIRFGMTNPVRFCNPAAGEYQQLAIGATFDSLTAVPSIFQGAPDVDVSRLPQTKGYADLLMIFAKDERRPAWLAAVREDEGWLWFSLKDPRVLPATTFWLENGGRHQAPWRGRNNCVGLEDVCAFFAEGLVPSASENILNRQGIPTAHDLSGNSPFHVRYIQGMARIPKGFEAVQGIDFAPGKIVIRSVNGPQVTVPVRHEYLRDGKL